MCAQIFLVQLVHLKTLLWLCYVVLVLFTIGVIVLDKRDPVKSLAWITVVALLPYLGMILYVIFGRNHRKEKIFNRKEIKDLQQIDKFSLEQFEQMRRPDQLLRKNIADNIDVISLLLNSNKTPLILNNRVAILNNGKDTFASIIDALSQAKYYIHLEYYIIENDRIGKRIAKILMEKARAGVEVRLIYDDVGSWGLSPKFVNKLKKSGVEVKCFMPVVFPWLTSKVNYRNHRKIIVVDGLVAFTGGINIADRYFKRGKLGVWRDTHLKVEGDAAHMLQVVFGTDWFFLSKRQLLSDPKYFPRHNITDELPMQIATSGPDSDWASIMQAFFSAMTKAQKHIYISSPYFLPNQAILTALKVASLSGIDVRILIPSRSDSKIVYWATRSYISELLNAGIKVYFYNKGFNHSKIIMIDSVFSSVGTANMDIRSFEDNFEVSAIMYDTKVAKELEGFFLKDLKNSSEITVSMWDHRSRLHSIYESFSRLLSPLL